MFPVLETDENVRVPYVNIEIDVEAPIVMYGLCLKIGKKSGTTIGTSKRRNPVHIPSCGIIPRHRRTFIGTDGLSATGSRTRITFQLVRNFLSRRGMHRGIVVVMQNGQLLFQVPNFDTAIAGSTRG